MAKRLIIWSHKARIKLFKILQYLAALEPKQDLFHKIISSVLIKNLKSFSVNLKLVLIQKLNLLGVLLLMNSYSF
jgi:hypothetical protein